MKIIKTWLPNSLKHKLKQTARTILESPQYWLKRNTISAEAFRHIVFVCQGNVCRSVFSEYYLHAKNLPRSVTLESCGLDVHHHGPPPEQAIKIAADLGVDIRPHLSKSYKVCDFARADLIVAMEYPQYQKLANLFPEYRNKTHLLKDFAPWPRLLNCNIYDPYGQNEAVFRACFSEIAGYLENIPLSGDK